jgi:hypothetical protein
MSELEQIESNPDDLQYLDKVLEDVGTSKHTRRGLMKHAMVGAAAVRA